MAISLHVTFSVGDKSELEQIQGFLADQEFMGYLRQTMVSDDTFVNLCKQAYGLTASELQKPDTSILITATAEKPNCPPEFILEEKEAYDVGTVTVWLSGLERGA